MVGRLSSFKKINRFDVFQRVNKLTKILLKEKYTAI